MNFFTPEDGTKFCLETSVRNYHYRMRNVPEERRSHLLDSSCKSVCLSSRIRSTSPGLLWQPLKKVKIWLKLDQNTGHIKIFVSYMSRNNSKETHLCISLAIFFNCRLHCRHFTSSSEHPPELKYNKPVSNETWV